MCQEKKTFKIDDLKGRHPNMAKHYQPKFNSDSLYALKTPPGCTYFDAPPFCGRTRALCMLQPQPGCFQLRQLKGPCLEGLGKTPPLAKTLEHRGHRKPGRAMVMRTQKWLARTARIQKSLERTKAERHQTVYIPLVPDLAAFTHQRHPHVCHASVSQLVVP